MSNSDTEILESGPLVDAIRQNVVLVQSEEDDYVVDEVFITEDDDGDDRVVTEGELVRKILERSMSCWDAEKIHNESKNSALLDVAKSVPGTTQSDRELGADVSPLGVSHIKVVQPPYPPELLSAFLEVDETHFRCVRTKVSDAVGREFMLDPLIRVRPNAKPVGHVTQEARRQVATEGVDQKEIDDETTMINEFIETSNDIISFESVIDRAAMDYEAIGWGALEIIRSIDGKIRKIAHIPATRIRVLRGWKGFVEKLSDTKFVYYQNFGEKLVSTTLDPVSKKPRSYNPKEDGELNLTNQKLSWSMIGRKDGEPTEDFAESANELLWIPKNHSNTIYYGYTDVIPALGSVLANVNIRDYLLQFFEHNTVPRYAVIVEGAKIAKEVKLTIQKYFTEQVKGKAHKTLIIPVPGRGEVRVRFEKLDADSKEGSFQETRKNNQQNIMTAHGVSPAIIGIAESANLGSGKGLSQAEIYKDRIVTPTQRIWARCLNKMFRLGLGVTKVALKFNPLDIRDKQSEAEVFSKYLEVGAVNINQIRKRTGLGDPIPGGDRNFIVTPQGIMFVDELTEATSAQIEELEQEIEELNNKAAVSAETLKITAAKTKPSPPGSPSA